MKSITLLCHCTLYFVITAEWRDSHRHMVGQVFERLTLSLFPLPDDAGSIVITHNPLYSPSAFEKQITVLQADQSETILTIMGKVISRPKGLLDYYPFAIDNLWFKEGTLFPASFYTNHDTVFTLNSSVYNASDKTIEIKWDESTIPDFIQVNTLGK